MSKQELINQITEFATFFYSFIEEYKNEQNLGNAEMVYGILDDIKHNLLDESIPEAMYPRIQKLVDQLAINKLIEQSRLWGTRHDFTKYEETYKDIVINSFFVSKTFYLFRAIGFVSSNVVLIGANGSGKTQFANSIREELERTDSGIVLPAQKLLIIPTYSHVPTFQPAYSAYNKREKESLNDKQTFTASQDNDIPYTLVQQYGSEMRLLLSALLGERVAKRNKYCSGVNNGDIVNTELFRSVLDEVIEIWNNLIGHRELFCDDSCNLLIRYGDKQYQAYKMSDGEREIFYIVGRVLLAKESALIVVDEPELHLHKSILNKLWDELEQRRSDCMFIYMTHDVDFASTRSAKKCWLKSYSSELTEEWDVEPIVDNIIPEPLLMKLLGSRKKILFCEGTNQSLDNQIFEILFPDYTIVPVATCKNVIDFTRAFNKIEGKYSEAFGIIDTDFRTREQLNKLSSENVFTYSVAEIENLFLIEDFISGFAEYKKEKCNLSEVKNQILMSFENDIDQQTSFYVTQKINFLFNESYLKKGKTRDEVNHFFSDFIAQVKIDQWYEERRAELRAIVTGKDYERAIKVYNNKGLHKKIEKALGISYYNKKALDYLRHSEKAKTILRQVFPAQIQGVEP